MQEAKTRLPALVGMLIRRPVDAFREFGTGSRRINWIWLFLAGIFVVQFWVQVLGLDHEFGMGPVMSASLLLGPLFMVGWLLLTVVILRLGGRILGLSQPEEAPKYIVRRAPLPFRFFLWNPVFGRKKINRSLMEGPLSGYNRSYNKIVESVENRTRSIWGGRPTFALLFRMGLCTIFPLLIMGLIGLVEFISEPKILYFPENPISIILKGICILAFVLLWLPLTKAAYNCSPAKAILLGTLSIGLAGVVLAMVLWLIFAIPIFGL